MKQQPHCAAARTQSSAEGLLANELRNDGRNISAALVEHAHQSIIGHVREAHVAKLATQAERRRMRMDHKNGQAYARLMMMATMCPSERDRCMQVNTVDVGGFGAAYGVHMMYV